MKIYNPRYEAISRPELEQLQLERLQSLLVRLKRNVRRHREKLADQRVTALADLAQLPFTTPEEMADSFPYGLFAFPLREVIRLHTTVGPEGRPLVIGHTRNDLAQWGQLVARQLVASGVTANDVIQICLGGQASSGASGYFLGAELIEASVIAEDPAHVDYQVAMLRNYRPTILIATPANARELIRHLEQQRIDPQSLNLRAVLLSRPVDAATREQIGAGLFAKIQCNFGLGEILDPGFCVECEQGHFHVHEDHFLVESVAGELVVTTLCREAMPLLRLRTRLACQISLEKCGCGRTGARLLPGARLDGRRRVNEGLVDHQQISDVLARTRVAGHQCQIEFTDTHVVVSLIMTPDLFSDTIGFLQKLQYEIEAEFQSRLGIQAVIRFVSPAKP